MKILIISWYFPPHNTMGALRVGKFAKHLLAKGHDVRVVAGRDLPYPRTLPLEVPQDRVRYTKWYDVNFLPRAVQALRVRLRRAAGGADAPDAADSKAAPTPVPGAENATAPPPRPSMIARLLRRARDVYMTVTNWPDPYIGWLPGALRGGKAALSDWRPDVIFASAPPFTALLAARRLARRHRIPWIAEYRDRWAEDPYGADRPIRRSLEFRHENRVLASAAGIVTVSEPWAADYRARWGKPTEVVYNGFDPADYPSDMAAPDRAGADTLRIVYTGILYPDRRDPSPLFAAIAAMGDEGRRIRVEFYGANPETLAKMAARHGVTGQVGIHPPVPYRDALALQRGADVLLLLQWNDPREAGNCPGKLFEYLAARRPVLLLGLETGVPATLLTARGAGMVRNTPDVIGPELQRWLAAKQQNGGIPDLPETVRAGLSRAEQYDKLIGFLDRVAGPQKSSPTSRNMADT